MPPPPVMPPAQGALFGTAREWPGGLAYADGFLCAASEDALLREFAALDFHAARYKAYTAKRRVVSYGSSYDFGDNALNPAPPIPAFLLPLRAAAGAWASIAADALQDALIAEYAPGTQLGWHRDVPDFEQVIGISLSSECTMRFRPYPPPGGRGGGFALHLAPRSIYLISGEARWRWQHMIPPTPSLRYSITFRTRRARRAGDAT